VYDDSKKDTHGVLFILDEFPTLGKMDMFTSFISYLRGYKVRLLITDHEQPIISKKLRYHDFPYFKDRVIEPVKLKF
jgi:type IV secretory pathway TraG/TraD family ATPase VirD4